MFIHRKYPFLTPPELSGKATVAYNVVVVGAGPVGLTLALALAKLGVQVMLLDENDQVSEGSKAICFSKRSLEIYDKLGVAGPMMEKGVKWDTGRIFYKGREIDSFHLSPDQYSKSPPFINLQQYYVEHFLVDAALKEKNLEIRWLTKVNDVLPVTDAAGDSPVRLNVSTPAGDYQIGAKFVIACDGSRSTIRQRLKLQMKGERFDERFLIVDFIMNAGFPSERWFMFDPLFAPGQSILLHKQPDNHWRLDFKLGKTAPDSLATDEPFIRGKIKSVVGDRVFDIAWASIYSFSNKMLDKFVHGRVIFAGDSAHVFSPFGARGANAGIEDADNLAWKLALVCRGDAQMTLLDTYDRERTTAAVQNIAFVTHSATFIAPPTEYGLQVRNEILERAVYDNAAKKQINCGRLSTPGIYCKYAGSENGSWRNSELHPGRPLKDCFLNPEGAWLMERCGYRFAIICLEDCVNERQKNDLQNAGCKFVEINAVQSPELVKMYELTKGACYLVSPDQYILGRWKYFSVQLVASLVKKYLAGESPQPLPVEKTAQDLLINRSL